MVELIDKFLSFIKYWYFRYLLVTELYMVEKWERNFINIFMVSLFGLFFLFNYNILLPTVSSYLVTHS